MKNLICIFFGHNEDGFLLKKGGHDIWLAINDIRIGEFRRCKRCGDIFIKSLPMSGK